MVWRLPTAGNVVGGQTDDSFPRTAAGHLMIGSRPVQAIYSSDEALSVHVGGVFHMTA